MTPASRWPALLTATAIAMGLSSCCHDKGQNPGPTSAPELSTPSPSCRPAPSNTDAAGSHSAARGPSSSVWNGTWPMPSDCLGADACKTADGEPGVRCSQGAPCYNPCPKGMGPEKGGSSCARLCKSKADCRAGRCTTEGICDRWPAPVACDAPHLCDLPGARTGIRCKPTDVCVSPCKDDLALVGGTHCAKVCWKNDDCPAGACTEGVCTPLCPSEGCPYRWE
jgi:hypothetical protein